MKILKESVIPIHFNFDRWPFKIRIWRQEELRQRINNFTVEEDVGKLVKEFKQNALIKTLPEDLEQLAINILSIPCVNAVEISNESGLAICLYKDWP